MIRIPIQKISLEFIDTAEQREIYHDDPNQAKLGLESSIVFDILD